MKFLLIFFLSISIGNIQSCPFKSCKEYTNPVFQNPLCVCGEGILEFKFEKNNSSPHKNVSVLKIYNFKSIPSNSFSGLNIEELILANSKIKILWNQTFAGLNSIRIIQFENLISLTRIGTNALDFLSKRITEMRLINVKTLNAINFRNFEKLEILDIQMSTVHYLYIIKSKSLQLIRVKDSRIAYLNIYELPALSDFYLQNSRLLNFKIWNTSVSFMDISSNIIMEKLEIYDLKKLKDLALDYNNLNDTHTKILRSMTDLENLSLIGNSIQNINFLNNMTKLSTLDLSMNKIKLFNFKVPNRLTVLRMDKNLIENDLKFNEPNSLKLLSLTDNKVPSIHIQNQNEILNLYLNRNPFKNISISGCTKIKNLQFRDVSLDSLVVRNMTLLEQIDFINVKWKNILMENLGSLTNINTINTSILNFLDNITVPNLKDLMVARSNLSTIPVRNLSKFQLLTSLELTENNLNSFNNISFFKNKVLGFSKNKFSNSEDLKSILNNNKYVDLSFNLIRNLSLDGDGSQLFALDLSSNRIEKFEIFNFTSLLYLNLANNNLSSFKADRFSSLTTLDLSNNKIQSQNFIISSQSLKTLDLTENNLRNFRFDLFRNLAVLILSRNNFTGLNYSSESLVQLDLSFNRLTNLSFLSNFPYLEKLDVSGNLIRTLDINVFRNNFYLKSVDLSNNYLSIIPSFSGLEYFEFLNMSNQNDRLTEIRNFALSNQNDTYRQIDLTRNKISKFGNKMLCDRNSSKIFDSISIHIDCDLKVNKCIYQNLARFITRSKCNLDKLMHNCHQNLQFVFYEPLAEACPKG